MILVSLLYIVVWTPGFIHFLFSFLHTRVMIGEAGYYVILVVGYLYICANPFIYATNFDPVKSVLVRLIPWKRNTQPHESMEMG